MISDHDANQHSAGDDYVKKPGHDLRYAPAQGIFIGYRDYKQHPIFKDDIATAFADVDAVATCLISSDY